MGRLTPVSSGRSRHVNNAAMGMQHRQNTGRFNAEQASSVDDIRTRRVLEGAIAEQTTGRAGRLDLSNNRLSGSIAGCTILAIMALSLVPGAQGAPAPTLPQGHPSQNPPPPTTDPF